VENDEQDCVECFFFQAEDGIRDWSVTGVQTCALPIFEVAALRDGFNLTWEAAKGQEFTIVTDSCGSAYEEQATSNPTAAYGVGEIGRASCRERVEVSGVGVAVEKNKGERTHLRRAQEA